MKKFLSTLIFGLTLLSSQNVYGNYEDDEEEFLYGCDILGSISYDLLMAHLSLGDYEDSLKTAERNMNDESENVQKLFEVFRGDMLRDIKKVKVESEPNLSRIKHSSILIYYKTYTHCIATGFNKVYKK